MKVLLTILAAGAAMAAPQDSGVTPADAGDAPSIDTIMSRVARNQAKTLDARTGYVYNQTQLLKMLRGSHKVAREEHREYVVTPKDRGIEKKLAHFDGKYESHGQYVAFDQPGYHYKSLDLDADLLQSFSEELTDDKKARDGIASDLFPLTYHQQMKYDFKLKGIETHEGRRVYHVSFVPKPKLTKLDDGGTVWKGEALIDAAEFQPVRVTTSLAWKVPLAVKTLLGTNVSGLGYTVNYQRLGEGLWFPVSYGGEFRFRGLFLYERSVTISMKNSDFKRTDVTSNIAYANGQ